MLGDLDPSCLALDLSKMRNRPSSVSVPPLEIYDGGHLNLIVPSLTRGGAERCVLDVLHALEGRVRSGKLFVLNQVRDAYSGALPVRFEVIWANGPNRASRLRDIATQILASANPSCVTHIIKSSDLRLLWTCGVKTFPVVHNSKPGWHDPVEDFHTPHVQVVIAVCQSVADQLKEAGIQVPVSVLRHEVTARSALAFSHSKREEVRGRYGIAADTLLVGMVGQFKAHKCYVRAVRVLAQLREKADAKLIVLGGWDHAHGAGRLAYAATMRLAEELGVSEHLMCPGSFENVEDFYSAFDVFLNTSVYEGMSIATLEAVCAGCPVVSADVGGQREAVGASDMLVSTPSDIAAYVNAIQEIRTRGRQPPSVPSQVDLVPRLWGWLAEFGRLEARCEGAMAEVVFATSNLNPGGAQRSLTNLVSTPGWAIKPWVCVLDRVLGDELLMQLQQAGLAHCVSLSHASSLMNRVGSFLALTRRLGARTICFWNVDPVFKLLVAKVLEHAPIRLVDVSPGPMLYDELHATGALQRRISFSDADYLRRLDMLVAKYQGGIPKDAITRSSVVIPNGVAVRPEHLPIDRSLLPPGADPRYALVTSCRLVPNKQLEWVVDLMECLAKRCPQATLTIIGGTDQRHLGYLEGVLKKIEDKCIGNIHFVGPRANLFSVLPAFSQFVMVSRAQGCPNASLEAMSCGLPVLAKSDGGTSEQVVQGVTGFLSASDQPSELADRIMELFDDDRRRQAMGAAARQHVREHFGLEAMLSRYQAIL